MVAEEEEASAAFLYSVQSEVAPGHQVAEGVVQSPVVEVEV